MGGLRCSSRRTIAPGARGVEGGPGSPRLNRVPRAGCGMSAYLRPPRARRARVLHGRPAGPGGDGARGRGRRAAGRGADHAGGAAVRDRGVGGAAGPPALHLADACEGDADYSVRWRLIKARFSRAVPMGERRARATCAAASGRCVAAAVLGAPHPGRGEPRRPPPLLPPQLRQARPRRRPRGLAVLLHPPPQSVGCVVPTHHPPAPRMTPPAMRDKHAPVGYALIVHAPCVVWVLRHEHVGGGNVISRKFILPSHRISKGATVSCDSDRRRSNERNTRNHLTTFAGKASLFDISAEKLSIKFFHIDASTFLRFAR